MKEDQQLHKETILRSIVSDRLLDELDKNIISVLRETTFALDILSKYEKLETCLKTRPEKIFIFMDIYVSYHHEKITEKKALARIADEIGSEDGIFGISSLYQPPPELMKTVIGMIKKKLTDILKNVAFNLLTDYYSIPREEITQEKKQHTLLGCWTMVYLCHNKKPFRTSKLNMGKIYNRKDRQSLEKLRKLLSKK